MLSTSTTTDKPSACYRLEAYATLLLGPSRQQQRPKSDTFWSPVLRTTAAAKPVQSCSIQIAPSQILNSVFCLPRHQQLLNEIVVHPSESLNLLHQIRELENHASRRRPPGPNQHPLPCWEASPPPVSNAEKSQDQCGFRRADRTTKNAAIHQRARPDRECSLSKSHYRSCRTRPLCFVSHS